MPVAVGVMADSYNKPAAGGFDPLSIPWHTVFWAQAPTWTPPADGGAVAQWNDASGNARHATQATGTLQPLYRASLAALNGKPAVDSASSDWLATPTWTAIPQPWSLVTIIHNRVAANAAFTDGDSTHRAQIGINSGFYALYAGAFLNGLASDTNSHLIVGYVTTSPNSQIEMDGVVRGTGNAGTHTCNGLKLFCNTNSSAFCSAEMAFVGVYAGDVRAHASWAGFKSWVTSHYGIVVT